MTREEFDTLCRDDVRRAVEENLGRDPLAVALDRRTPHAAPSTTTPQANTITEDTTALTHMVQGRGGRSSFRLRTRAARKSPTRHTADTNHRPRATAPAGIVQLSIQPNRTALSISSSVPKALPMAQPSRAYTPKTPANNRTDSIVDLI